MADRTSAGVFGTIFELLAENPTAGHKAMAFKIYAMSRQYDFSPYQMEADEACKKLGLLRRGINSSYPDDGIKSLWPSDRGYEQVIAEGETGALDATGKVQVR